MPKAIKGNAGRKPPEHSANHSDIDDWCRRLMPCGVRGSSQRLPSFSRTVSSNRVFLEVAR
jgi:hypothetical protein